MDEHASYHNQSFDDISLVGTELAVFNASREQAAMQGSAEAGSMYSAAAAQAMNGGGGRKRVRKSTGYGNGQPKRARGAVVVPAPAPAPDPDASAGQPSTLFDPEALSKAAKLISKANKRPSVPKARRPWTVHDTQQLVLAIDIYKAKWSTIEKAIKGNHIPFNIIERDQQGLRDKARLVKVDILKYVHEGLPTGDGETNSGQNRRTAAALFRSGCAW